VVVRVGWLGDDQALVGILDIDARVLLVMQSVVIRFEVVSEQRQTESAATLKRAADST